MIKILNSILLISIVTCGQINVNPNEKEATEDWKTLDQTAYSIQYPSTWELNQSGQMGTSFFLFSPLESDTDKFRENVTLVIQNLKGMDIDLDRYVAITEQQIKTMLTNSSLIENKRMEDGKNGYHKMIYSGEQGIYQLQFEQYYWVVGEKAYVLTFTSEKDKFDGFKETGEKILNSFALK